MKSFLLLAIIIFSILVLSLLVGCTSELDRCVEANFQQKDFVPKKDKDYIRSMCATNFNAYDQSVTSYKECAEKKLAEMDAMFTAWATEDAKKICHSQGIY